LVVVVVVLSSSLDNEQLLQSPREHAVTKTREHDRCVKPGHVLSSQNIITRAKLGPKKYIYGQFNAVLGEFGSMTNHHGTWSIQGY
jgi:hypothetical protein